MTQEDNGETYSVIYAALKHPLRRKILRLLKEEELTYTQILNKLDVDTGHLNYYIESLGELLAKTSEGKYRLSDYGLAAVKLMAGVEETDSDNIQSISHRFSRRKFTRLIQIICIAALILSGALLMSINYVESYSLGSSGSFDSKDLITLAPNQTLSNVNPTSARNYHADTLTTHYRAFLQIELLQANVSLHVEVTEAVYPQASFPGEETGRYVQYPVLIHNETYQGPCGTQDANGSATFLSKLSHAIKIPVSYPQEKGLLVSNSFTHYAINVTNLGTALLYHPSNATAGNGSISIVANNTGALYLYISHPLIERTDNPYFYHGLTLIILAAITAILPSLVFAGKRIKGKGFTSSAA